MTKEKIREFAPMKCQTPNANEMVCKDCVYRDHTAIEVDGKTIPAGTTKGNCEMYVYPDIKPSEVLFNGADCNYYEEE